MNKSKIIEELIKKIDELEENPIETIEKDEMNTYIETYKNARNNGITRGLIIACDLILELDIDN